MKEYSMLAPSSSVAPSAIVEHPIHCGPTSQIQAECQVGCYLFLNIGSVIYPKVNIGRFCSIARGCEIGVANHPTSFLSTHAFQYSPNQFPHDPVYKNEIERGHWANHSPTQIGNDVWIGAQSIVKSGITIGDGAIIAANSVVTKDVPPYAVVGGTPATILKMRFSEKRIDELLSLKWWDLPLNIIGKLPFGDIDACIASLKEINKEANRSSLD